MGFMVFSNLGDFNPGGKLYQMADLFIKDTATKKETVKKEKRDSVAAVLNDTVSMQKFVGSYINESGLPFSFNIKNSRLYYKIYNENNFLIKEQNNTFSIPDAPEIKFVFGIKTKDTVVDIFTPDQSYHLKKYIKDTSQPDELLKIYTGVYSCPELDCKYNIVLKDGRLMLTNNKYNETKLTLINNDHLTNDHCCMSHLLMIRDSANNITGFEVNSGRIMHLKFNKIE